MSIKQKLTAGVAVFAVIFTMMLGSSIVGHNDNGYFIVKQSFGIGNIFC